MKYKWFHHACILENFIDFHTFDKFRLAIMKIKLAIMKSRLAIMKSELAIMKSRLAIMKTKAVMGVFCPISVL